MLETLKPKYVLVYGRMAKEIFCQYEKNIKFISFESEVQNSYDKRKGEK